MLLLFSAVRFEGKQNNISELTFLVLSTLASSTSRGSPQLQGGEEGSASLLPLNCLNAVNKMSLS